VSNKDNNLDFMKAFSSSNDALFRIINTLPQALFWKDTNSVYLGCNQYFSDAAGLASPDDIVGKTDYELPWHKEQSDFFVEVDRRVMKNNKAELNIIESMIKANGKNIWLQTNKMPLHDDNGQVNGVICTFIDVTERVNAQHDLEALNKDLELRVKQRTKELELANQELEQIAKLDYLTQIPNRRAFVEYFDRVWHSHFREKNQFSLMMVDVDYFKRFNDANGHLAGDQTLQKVANHLKHLVQREAIDFVARIGGEEFVILLPNTGLDGAKNIANHLLTSIESQHISHPDSPVSPYITVSIGLNVVNPNLSTPEDTMKNTDHALYQAKHHGRNQYQVFSSTTI
jgi:diguanylate cyclase (GGDEF)-like protein/PAS domain S-box-containing protein